MARRPDPKRVNDQTGVITDRYDFCPALADGPIKGVHHMVEQDIIHTERNEFRIVGYTIESCTECGGTLMEDFHFDYTLAMEATFMDIDVVELED